MSSRQPLQSPSWSKAVMISAFIFSRCKSIRSSRLSRKFFVLDIMSSTNHSDGQLHISEQIQFVYLILSPWENSISKVAFALSNIGMYERLCELFVFLLFEFAFPLFLSLRTHNIKSEISTLRYQDLNSSKAGNHLESSRQIGWFLETGPPHNVTGTHPHLSSIKC